MTVWQHRLKGTALGGALGLLLAPAIASGAPPPLRHLVYTFQFGVQQSAVARDSANQAGAAAQGSGLTHYNGSLGDHGTITVNVLGEEKDHGLVVEVSEQASDTRNAGPATCVVYASTTVLCDPNKTVNIEEYTLLRFLAGDFVPTAIDAHHHWSIAQKGAAAQVQADYTIVHQDGAMMTIDESRTTKQKLIGAPDLVSNGQTKITYDAAHDVPTSIDEYVTQIQAAGAQTGMSSTIFQTELALKSDSMAQR